MYFRAAVWYVNEWKILGIGGAAHRRWRRWWGKTVLLLLVAWLCAALEKLGGFSHFIPKNHGFIFTNLRNTAKMYVTSVKTLRSSTEWKWAEVNICILFRTRQPNNVLGGGDR